MGVLSLVLFFFFFSSGLLLLCINHSHRSIITTSYTCSLDGWVDGQSLLSILASNKLVWRYMYVLTKTSKNQDKRVGK
ncbi:hypothetical protein GGR55DRAFT_669818, partial [Xylaria sp. FL0064]